MSIIPKHREGRSRHEYYYVGMTTSACGVVPHRQPDSNATGCGSFWLPSIRGQLRSMMVARRRPGPEDGWRGSALHYCLPKLFDGCALATKFLLERAQTA